MSSGVTIKGFKEKKLNLKRVMPDLNKEVKLVLVKYGKLMQKQARADHKFKTQTGQGERAISFKVDSKRWMLKFYIDDVRVYVNGFNYLWGQNDGTLDGYKRGKISPVSSSKGQGKGIRADDFMGRAWEMYVDDLTKELQKTLIRVLS